MLQMQNSNCRGREPRFSHLAHHPDDVQGSRQRELSARASEPEVLVGVALNLGDDFLSLTLVPSSVKCKHFPPTDSTRNDGACAQ